MIAIDELKSTIARLNLLADNTDSADEKIMTNVIVTNLVEIAKQAEMISDSPQFKQQAEIEQEAMRKEKNK